MKNVALGIAFILEMVAFAGFACLGLLLHLAPAIRIVSVITLFVVLIIFWSMFMAPRAAHKFHAPIYYVAKTVIYSLAALVIWQKTSPSLGVSFAVLVIASEAALFKHNLS